MLQYSLFVETLSARMHMVLSLRNTSTLLGVVEFSRQGTMSMRFWRGVCDRVGADFFFLLRNNCERNVVVAAAKHATSTLTLSKFQLSRLPLLYSSSCILHILLFSLLILYYETSEKHFPWHSTNRKAGRGRDFVHNSARNPMRWRKLFE